MQQTIKEMEQLRIDVASITETKKRKVLDQKSLETVYIL